MSASASERLGIEPAPGGLVLVQELINTALADPGHPLPDLLAERATAQPWLEQALTTWAQGRAAPRITLADADLDALRALRAALRGGPAAPPGRIEVDLAGYRPLGHGAQLLAALVYTEILLARHNGAWARLRTCQNPVCQTAFYDSTRN